MGMKLGRKHSRRMKTSGDSERGGLDVFMLMVLSTLIAFAGFAFDMGMFFNAHREAQGIAAAAARAGADQVQTDALYSQGLAKIDRGRAASEARTRIPSHAIERRIEVTHNDEQILVEVAIQHQPLILSAFGVGTMEATGEAIARVANEAP